MTVDGGRRLAGLGLIGWAVLVALSIAVPLMAGWRVYTSGNEVRPVPPLHAEFVPGAEVLPLLAALSLGALVWWLQPRLLTCSWPRLLGATFAIGLAFLLALALTNGVSGLTRIGWPSEYLPSAREVDDLGAFLRGYVDRIPYRAENNLVIHLAGHPPGAVLSYIGLVRLGLGDDVVAGLITAAVGASTPVAVLLTLRRLGAESAARRVAPFLIAGPAALWFGVSADAGFAAAAAWGLTALAYAATAPGARSVWAWSILAGLLLGWCVLLSYGLPLLGTIALAVLWVARSWKPLPIAAVTALLVVGAMAALGFVWWEALPVLHERYWNGLAGRRPTSYWWWGNLGALALCAGPALAAGLGALAGGVRRADRAVLGLVTGALASILIADGSLMSKAEVERIWLPFVPWLLVVTAALPTRWQRPVLVLQLLTAVLLEVLLDTSW